MLSMDKVGGTGEEVFVLDSSSLSRSETSINLLRAIWEGFSSIFTLARVTLFRGDVDLAVSSGVGRSTDMPGTTAGGINNLLLSLPTDIKKKP